MSKINKIGFFNKESGESLNYEIITSIQKEEVRNNVRRIFYNLQNKNIDDLSLEDLEVVMKLHKRNSENILIDLSANNEKYFIIKDNFKICRKLDKNTKSMLYEISQLITHDNTIVTKNNIPLSDFKELCEYIEMPYSVWRNTVSKYNKEFNIIKKEKINNKFYLVLNPLFAIKSRNITEYVFKCFFKELKEYLHPIDYIYLVKLYGINPELIYKNETIKNTSLDIDFIDLKPN